MWTFHKLIIHSHFLISFDRVVKNISKSTSFRGRPYMTSDARGREGVVENLMISDEGGRGGHGKSDVRWRKIHCFRILKKPVELYFQLV